MDPIGNRKSANVGDSSRSWPWYIFKVRATAPISRQGHSHPITLDAQTTGDTRARNFACIGKIITTAAGFYMQWLCTLFVSAAVFSAHVGWQAESGESPAGHNLRSRRRPHQQVHRHRRSGDDSCRDCSGKLCNSWRKTEMHNVYLPPRSRVLSHFLVDVT